jgi:hypothetical protein
MHYSQLVELTENQLPKIWLVNATIESDKITFEADYLGDGYGAKNAVLVPDGCTYPQFTVTIPSRFSPSLFDDITRSASLTSHILSPDLAKIKIGHFYKTLTQQRF